MAEQGDLLKARPNLTASKQALLEKWRRGEFSGLSQAPAIPRCSRTSAIPLSFAQQRLWFLEQLMPGNTAYTIYGAFRLKGVLDLVALEQSINKIISRHEALRTVFTTVDEQPVQIILPELRVLLAPDTLEDLPGAERERAARRLSMEELQRPFDLVQGPLFRTRLLRLAPEEHTLLISMHHSIGDG